METTAQEVRRIGWAEGRAEGKAESFFILARKMFKEIPSKWKA